MPTAPTPAEKPKTLATRLLTSRPVQRYLFACASIVVRFRKPLVVGVTGTAGKTTTVTLIAAVLSHPTAVHKWGRIWHTDQNMNDQNGFPLTLLGFHQWMTGWRRLIAILLMPFRALALSFFGEYPKLMVLEYGTDRAGDLPRLVKLLPPAIGVITSIGPAHLDGLKTVRGVMEEKSSLVSQLPPSGLAVLGTDHEYVADLRSRTQARTILIPGRGQALSRAIARVIGLEVGLSPQVIDAALESVPSVQGRLQQFRVGRMIVVDDTFNANPLSVRLGLDTLYEIGATDGQRRVAFLGAMAELGEESERYHREIGAHARKRADLVIGVGEQARLYAADHWFPDSSVCSEHLKELVRDGDCILVKGSKSVKMGVVAKTLRDFDPDASAPAEMMRG